MWFAHKCNSISDLCTGCPLHRMIAYQSAWHIIISCLFYYWASQVVLVVTNPPINAGNIRDTGSIPGSGRSPGGGHGNPLQYSFLDNPKDRGAWWAPVYRVARSWTRLEWLSMHTDIIISVILSVFLLLNFPCTSWFFIMCLSCLNFNSLIFLCVKY